ncbi:hypothetical protein pb186bvf_015554 [Paramecium bursaria]
MKYFPISHRMKLYSIKGIKEQRNQYYQNDECLELQIKEIIQQQVS